MPIRPEKADKTLPKNDATDGFGDASDRSQRKDLLYRCDEAGREASA